eukprot:TRINITY_DN23446_c0_g1_i1.p1 TRINITY_DN23446_c0_g1~~TRINITY_DN23446_c0_g1_i1.p1  ORF type:complete len:1660 (+),score=163.51 TRINITY_DN23446_c0_g1_i1:77-5056(+)
MDSSDAHELSVKVAALEANINAVRQVLEELTSKIATLDKKQLDDPVPLERPEASAQKHRADEKVVDRLAKVEAQISSLAAAGAQASRSLLADADAEKIDVDNFVADGEREGPEVDAQRQKAKDDSKLETCVESSYKGYEGVKPRAKRESATSFASAMPFASNPDRRPRRSSRMSHMLTMPSAIRLEESCWDAMVVCGIHAGVGESVVVIFLWGLNLVMQVLFLLLISSNMIPTGFVTQSDMKNYLNWRVLSAHKYQYYDSVTKTSLARRVCDGFGGSVLSSLQSFQLQLIQNYWPDGKTPLITGPGLLMLTMIMWVAVVGADFLKSLRFTMAILSRWGSTSEIVPNDDDTAFRLKSLSRRRIVIILMTVSLPRLCITGFLCWVGLQYLAFLTSMEDLILNVVALGFVLDLDEILYVFVPSTLKTFLHLMEPIEVSTWKNRRYRTMKDLLYPVMSICFSVAIFFIMFQSVSSDINLSRAVLCKGDLDFIFSQQPLSNIVMTATTEVGADASHDTLLFKSVFQRTGLEVAIGPQNMERLDVETLGGLERLISFEDTVQIVSDVALQGIEGEMDRRDCRDTLDDLRYRSAVLDLQRRKPGVFGNVTISTCADVLHFCESDLEQARFFARFYCPEVCMCHIGNSTMYNRSGCPPSCAELVTAEISSIQMSKVCTSLQDYHVPAPGQRCGPGFNGSVCSDCNSAPYCDEVSGRCVADPPMRPSAPSRQCSVGDLVHIEPGAASGIDVAVVARLQGVNDNGTITAAPICADTSVVECARKDHAILRIEHPSARIWLTEIKALDANEKDVINRSAASDVDACFDGNVREDCVKKTSMWVAYERVPWSVSVYLQSGDWRVPDNSKVSLTTEAGDVLWTTDFRRRRTRLEYKFTVPISLYHNVLNVSGCANASWNGLYRSSIHKYGQWAASWSKDPTKQIYKSSNQWELAQHGVWRYVNIGPSTTLLNFGTHWEHGCFVARAYRWDERPAAPPTESEFEEWGVTHEVQRDCKPPYGPCGLCEGDCDHDSDCAGDLKCFDRAEARLGNGGAPIPGCIRPDMLRKTAENDFCYDPRKALVKSPAAAAPPICTDRQKNLCPVTCGLCAAVWGEKQKTLLKPSSSLPSQVVLPRKNVSKIKQECLRARASMPKCISDMSCWDDGGQYGDCSSTLTQKCDLTIVSDGTRGKPHCHVFMFPQLNRTNDFDRNGTMDCQWNEKFQSECAQHLCSWSGFPGKGVLVSSSNPCNNSEQWMPYYGLDFAYHFRNGHKWGLHPYAWPSSSHWFVQPAQVTVDCTRAPSLPVSSSFGCFDCVSMLQVRVTAQASYTELCMVSQEECRKMCIQDPTCMSFQSLRGCCRFYEKCFSSTELTHAKLRDTDVVYTTCRCAESGTRFTPTPEAVDGSSGLMNEITKDLETLGLLVGGSLSESVGGRFKKRSAKDVGRSQGSSCHFNTSSVNLSAWSRAVRNPPCDMMPVLDYVFGTDLCSLDISKGKKKHNRGSFSGMCPKACSTCSETHEEKSWRDLVPASADAHLGIACNTHEVKCGTTFKGQTSEAARNEGMLGSKEWFSITLPSSVAFVEVTVCSQDFYTYILVSDANGHMVERSFAPPEVKQLGTDHPDAHPCATLSWFVKGGTRSYWIVVDSYLISARQEFTIDAACRDGKGLHVEGGG